jgi:hydrogenase/urease accessory protein HupE
MCTDIKNSVSAQISVEPRRITQILVWSAFCILSGTASILFGFVSGLPLKTCVVSLDIMWKYSLVFVVLLPLLHFVTSGLVRRCSTNGELLKSGLCVCVCV